MRRLKKNISYLTLLLALLTTVCFTPAREAESLGTGSAAEAISHRFVKMNALGGKSSKATVEQWACVLDNETQLLWEVKTLDGGIQDAKNSYSWYLPDLKKNGGFVGYQNKGNCPIAQCDTQAYINTINHLNLCGSDQWRLPSREELRSIIDYGVKYPGPMVNKTYFPNTQSQFYWSSVPDANDKDSAWGIGFSFGYDYAYFKSDTGHIRLVSGPLK